MHAHYANHNFAAAVSLCDRLRYNLHRSKGRLDAASLAASELLASLYASGDPAHPAETRRPDRAVTVYEDVLREIDSACAHLHDESKKKVLAATATRHLELLQRVGGGGARTKDGRDVEELHGRLTSRLGLKVAGPNTWATEGRSGAAGEEMYVAPKEWRLDDTRVWGGELQVK